MAGPRASDFFLDSLKDQLSQGDIVLAPTAVLWSDDTRAPEFMIPSPPELGGHVEVPVWDSYDGAEAPLTVAEVRWSPAVVLSHDCELDKEFNRAVSEYLESGDITEEEAIARASADSSLDPYVLVTPVLGYEVVPEEMHEGIRQGQTIGYFPIPPAPLFDDEELLLDLRRVTTVDRQLITRYEKLASLTQEAAGVLRYKLSEAMAWRSLAVLPEIEAMVGQTVRDLEISRKSRKKTALALHLGDGSVVHLEIRTPPPGLASAVEWVRKRLTV